MMNKAKLKLISPLQNTMLTCALRQTNVMPLPYSKNMKNNILYVYSIGVSCFASKEIFNVIKRMEQSIYIKGC